MESVVNIDVNRPFLVDVPVRVNIWIRPECQRTQFEVLKKARPSIMILQSDGGRNEKEWNAIRENRKIFDEEVNWNCKIYKFYEENNLGLYAMGEKISNFIWEHFDRCIFLEDDQIPAVCFFRFCAELLEKYKDDYRISRICGTNSVGTWEDASSDYFFSNDGCIWGTATWKRAIEQRDLNFAYGKDAYVMNLFKKQTKSYTYKLLEGYTKNKYYGGHVAGSEFWFEFCKVAYNQVQIIPRKNLISNVGYGEGSAHANGASIKECIPKYMYLPTFELDFPIKHPKFIIPDNDYSNRVLKDLGVGHPFLRLCKRIKYFSLLLLHGEFKYIANKVVSKFCIRKRIEK